MAKNLLLGNGINMRLKIKGLQEQEIAERFFQNLIRSSCLFELLFGVSFTEDICNALLMKTNKKGIESLSYFVHDYVLENMRVPKSINVRMRLLDAVICCAISAIFYKDNERLGDFFEEKNLPNIELYDNIFTLNYIEYWDKEDRSIYLHGKYDFDKVKCNNKPVLHYSYERYLGYKGYKELIGKMNREYNMCELYTRPIVFSPEFYKKIEMMSMGAYPSEQLYPSEDLFLVDMPELYVQLKDIYELDVFGVSPYGDDDLIKCLNTMDNVVVYVYNKENNVETTVWERVLVCRHVIKDSKEL